MKQIGHLKLATFILPRRRRLLVIETDGFALRGAIVRVRGRAAVVTQAAESRTADSGVALVEVLDQLESAHLPRRAVLVTPEAAAAVLELPVDPQRPRTNAQMQQLVRWELEPVFAQQAAGRPIGEIMVCRGHLTAQQAARVLEEQQRRRETLGAAAGAMRRPAPRFGELAIELNLATRAQVDECLAIQEQFQLADEDYVCGWSGQPAHGATGQDGPMADGHKRYRWLACGIGSSVRDRWVRRFAARGVRLERIYPLVGSRASSLDDAVTRNAVLCEVYSGLIGGVRFIDGQIASVQAKQTCDCHSMADTCRQLLTDGPPDSVWLSASPQALDGVDQELALRLGREVRFVQATHCKVPKGVAPVSLVGALSAARHASGQARKSSAVCVAARDPGPPLAKRPAVWWLAVGTAAGLLIAGLELTLAGLVSDAEQRRVRASEELAQVHADVQRAQEQAQRATQLAATLEARQKELAEVARLREFLEVSLPERGRFVASLLDGLADTVSDEVVVNQITEEAPAEIEVEAWALSEQAAQRFAQRLVSKLRRWDLTVRESDLRAAEGRLSLAGYAVNLKLIPGSSRAERPVLLSIRED